MVEKYRAVTRGDMKKAEQYFRSIGFPVDKFLADINRKNMDDLVTEGQDILMNIAERGKIDFQR